MPQRTVELALAAGLLTFVVSGLVCGVARHRAERQFVAQNPLFAEALSPLSFRLLPFGVIASLLTGVALSLLDDGPNSFAYVVGGLVFEIVCLVLLVRVRKRNLPPIPPESPKSGCVKRVVDAFGKPPKGTVLLRSLVPNAFALPDGRVMMTVALWAITTDDEAAAVVAHEMSHLRDGDSRRIRIAWIARILVAGLAVFGLIQALSARPEAGAYEIPLTVLVVPTVMIIGAALAAPSCRRLEFKCDAEAVRLSLAEPLISALMKIHAFGGVPKRPLGSDRLMWTHPPLDERIQRLRKSGSNEIQAELCPESAAMSGPVTRSLDG